MNVPLSEDRIAWLRISSCYLPLATPISDAKVLTGRQKPMTEIAMLFVEIKTANGHEAIGSGSQVFGWTFRGLSLSAGQSARAGEA